MTLWRSRTLVVVVVSVLAIVSTLAVAAACRTRGMRGARPIQAMPKAVPVAKAPAEPMAGSAVEILKTLESKRIRGLHWDQVSLDQAVSYLRTITGLNFYLSPRVREEKFDDVLISAQLDDVSVRNLLDDVLTAPWGMRWEVHDGMVRLQTVDEVGGRMFLRYYDVKDLVDVEDPGPGSSRTTEHLADELRRLSPSYWAQEGPVMEARTGILIVRASPAILADIDAALGQRRAAMRRPTIDAETTKKLEAIKINVALSDSTLGEVVKLLQLQTGVNLMIDPRIESEVKDNPITGLKLEDTSLMTALTMLASAAGPDAVWQSRGDVVVLTYREYAQAAR